MRLYKNEVDIMEKVLDEEREAAQYELSSIITKLRNAQEYASRWKGSILYMEEAAQFICQGKSENLPEERMTMSVSVLVKSM